MIKKTRLVAILLLAAWLGMSAVFAESLPEHYPTDFVISGSVDQINLKDRTIIISDTVYRMGNSMIVNQLGSVKSGVANQLKRGLDVGVSQIDRGVIYEVWVLPRGYDHDPIDQ